MTNNAANFARQILALSLLTLFASFAVSVQNAPKDDLQILSDEFNDEKSLADWKQFHEAEGWMTMTKTLDVNKTSAGNLHFEATVSGWYEDFHGGGGGFGKMFGAVAPVLGQVAPMAGMGGSVAGAIAGSVATTAIMTAATMSQNVKAKDAVELNATMQKASDKSNVLTKQLKGKAKSDGQDIITPLIEQTAQAVIDAATAVLPVVAAVEKE